MEFESNEYGLVDALDALKRRSKLLSIVTVAIFLIGALIALVLPSIYESRAIILIEQQEIPSDLVRSTVTSFAEQRIQVISQRVMSSSNLMQIIDEFDLYTDEREHEPREEILDRMRDNISLEMISADVIDPKNGRPVEATIAFKLAFEDKSAQKSQLVANKIVSAFLNENIQSRKDSAMETTSFLDSEAEILRSQVVTLEGKIAEFKDNNAKNRPELEVLTRDMMNRTEANLGEIDRRIHESVQQQIYLESELAQRKPIIPESGSQAERAVEQLRVVESQLAAAEASYGVAHPDVIRLRKQSEAMRATVEPNAARDLYEDQITIARATLNELLERYDSSHPDVGPAQRKLDQLQQKLDALPAATQKVPNNPAYVALAARRDAAASQVGSLERQRAKVLDKMQSYADSLMLMPDAEAKFRELNRDYEAAMVKYREISAKQMEARISQNLESERKGEKFTLIEPPLMPELPAKPNRPAILAIALILSIVGGLGSVSVVETMDNKIRGRRAVQDIFSAPPLAYIPVIDVDNASTRSLRTYSWVVVTLVAMVAVGMAVVHFGVMPLDVFWFTLMRKLGV